MNLYTRSRESVFIFEKNIKKQLLNPAKKYIIELITFKAAKHA